MSDGLFVLMMVSGIVCGVINMVTVLENERVRVYNIFLGVIGWPISIIMVTVFGIYYFFTKSKFKAFFTKELYRW